MTAMAFRAGPYQNGELAVTAMTGREAVSALYSFEIALAVPKDRFFVDTFDVAVLGRPATLTITASQESVRAVHGTVTNVRFDDVHCTRDDPRVTRAGRFLRRTSLDEVPNLVNVLRGEMSIVGPRPTIPAQVDDYTPRQRRRHEVLPGITGWAQVQGRAGIPWEERIELDVWYVDHRSFALDARILAKTAWLVVTGKGLAPD